MKDVNQSANTDWSQGDLEAVLRSILENKVSASGWRSLLKVLGDLSSKPLRGLSAPEQSRVVSLLKTSSILYDFALEPALQAWELCLRGSSKLRRESEIRRLAAQNVASFTEGEVAPGESHSDRASSFAAFMKRPSGPGQAMSSATLEATSSKITPATSQSRLPNGSRVGNAMGGADSATAAGNSTSDRLLRAADAFCNTQDSQISCDIRDVGDIVQARGEALRLALGIGFNKVDAVKLATCVSELARNIVLYAKSGQFQIQRVSSVARGEGLRLVASDKGPGIPHLDQVLSGNYQSKTGLGQGLRAVRELCDEFQVQGNQPQGTKVTATRWVRR